MCSKYSSSVPVKLSSDVREVNLYIKENRQITRLLYQLFQIKYNMIIVVSVYYSKLLLKHVIMQHLCHICTCKMCIAIVTDIYFNVFMQFRWCYLTCSNLWTVKGMHGKFGMFVEETWSQHIKSRSCVFCSIIFFLPDEALCT